MANNIEQAYELTLVVRSQIGDETAFEELLRSWSPRLRAYVSRMLGTEHEHTDDVLQEIWVNVFRALPRLHDAAAFRSNGRSYCEAYDHRHPARSRFAAGPGPDMRRARAFHPARVD